MKNKAILFLSIAAILTLSFTFVSVNRFSTKGAEGVQNKVDKTSSAQPGGFAMEDKL
ncbi:hypothetical protein [Ohtaekwangia koreensis]|uniref:Uncharacterized protein n=1 Tax=Ohtaekwangia koreensis TaxID=688867 RepID=A0A1T5JZN3_9BACT|nr:hypothetical protein [Ohtaekwangia koreensis]SKC56708.1 hypothetical protein SAMN05660236_1629 [Ohtaekwangia koreensis]